LSASDAARPRLLRSKLFWVALLYFSEGFPLGIFYDIFPVWFRQQGVELRSIGIISLLGLAWTLKFLWAPAIDHYRRHRQWMAVVDVLMGGVMLTFAITAGLPLWVWLAIAVFTLLSATNDIAIDGYTIELLDRNEMGLANGVRIGFYRVGMLAAGGILIMSDYLGWSGAFICAAVIFGGCAALCLAAPREPMVARCPSISLVSELRAIALQPSMLALVLSFALGCLWLADSVTRWSAFNANFWPAAWGITLAVFGLLTVARLVASPRKTPTPEDALGGPMFGALIELLKRPGILPVLIFILIFKLADASMGFMVKPFWVDSGFTATEIGLVSVNIGLGLSIAGGITGGWYTDRAGIYRALWVLGLFQAASNLGYALAAAVIPAAATGSTLLLEHRALLYSASAIESFTGGLGTAAFLAFLMAIVDKRRAATEYALLSSVFALSRSFAGWASGIGAQEMGYAAYFLLTFFLAFPAYFFLPWIRQMLARTETEPASQLTGREP
jgi:PAT family beta-lactamase induction signal transducer AmpG